MTTSAPGDAVDDDLERERTNADHLRALTRLQHAKLRRPLVRAALRLDGLLVRGGRRAAPHRRRLSAGASRVVLAVRAAPGRRALPARRAHLDRSLRSLDPPPRLARRVSLVVVTDGPVDLDRLATVDPPHEVISSGPGADAAAEAALRATGDLLCFVTGSTEALDGHWLARLAPAVSGTTVASTPVLVHPSRAGWRATPHDLLVRSAGYVLAASAASAPEIRARGAGTPVDVADRPVAVASGSAACLLVDRRAYLDAGGLVDNPELDAAVVDLCTRLRAAGGEVTVVPTAVMIDARPVPSTDALTRPIDPAGAGWSAVVDRHGPALLRATRRPDTTRHLRFAITISAPSMRAAAHWGDLPVADALATALRRGGHSVHVQALDSASSATGRSCDVHLVVRGKSPVGRTPGQAHVMWIISHPESIDVAECDEADLVLVASERFARSLRHRTSTPVEVMLQATDPTRFRPTPVDPEHAHPVAVVATSRGVFRPVVADALEVGLRPAVYGMGWDDFLDPELIVADFVPNDRLAVVYSSVGVLLNDHWDTMRAWGFVSNRLFDALACGASVVSDRLPEIHDLFGDAVATYDEPRELLVAVESALDDPLGASRRAEEGRARVLASHTFDDRARELLDALTRHGLDRILR